MQIQEIRKNTEPFASANARKRAWLSFHVEHNPTGAERRFEKV